MQVELDYNKEGHDAEHIRIKAGKHTFHLVQAGDGFRILAETGMGPQLSVLPVMGNVIVVTNASPTHAEWHQAERAGAHQVEPRDRSAEFNMHRTVCDSF